MSEYTVFHCGYLKKGKQKIVAEVREVYAQEIIRLKKELAALREDAERYGRAKQFLQHGNGTLDARGTNSATFDALIDALPHDEMGGKCGTVRIAAEAMIKEREKRK